MQREIMACANDTVAFGPSVACELDLCSLANLTAPAISAHQPVRAHQYAAIGCREVSQNIIAVLSHSLKAVPEHYIDMRMLLKQPKNNGGKPMLLKMQAKRITGVVFEQ